jgi:hypothetical protein
VFTPTVFYQARTAAPNTIKQQQRDAEPRIRQSIDRSIPVLVWGPTHIPEFGIIYGYDDLKREYLVHDVTQQPDLTLPTICSAGLRYLSYFIRLFINKTPVDETACYKASLNYALGEWNRSLLPE